MIPSGTMLASVGPHSLVCHSPSLVHEMRCIVVVYVEGSHVQCFRLSIFQVPECTPRVLAPMELEDGVFVEVMMHDCRLVDLQMNVAVVCHDLGRRFMGPELGEPSARRLSPSWGAS